MTLKKCNSDQWSNNDKCRCDCIKRLACQKDFNYHPETFSCGSGKYLTGIINDSAILCDEERRAKKKLILMEKMQSVKNKIFMFYLRFY